MLQDRKALSMRKGMTRWFTLLLAVLLAAGLVSAGALAEAVLPGEPVWGANPEYDLWTVVMRNEMGTTIPVTVCADKELTIDYKDIKGLKLKAKVQIEGDHLRVSSASRDTLQEVIAFLKDQDYGQPLQYINYR